MIDLKPQFLVDALDVLIVAFLFYRLFIMIKGTRASQMFVGLIIIVFASIVAQWFRLNALNWIIGSLKTVWVILFVILFQPELRALLTHIGQNRLVRALIRVEEYGVVAETIKAVEEMAKERRGAIIVFERDMGLRDYVETGTKIDASVSAELLETIFTPHSPLHDGAVVIRGDAIVAASCILPLSQTRGLSPLLGTRHRAALGLAEETDAAVIVVSEETGAISIAHKGELKWNLDEGQLRGELAAIFNPRPDETPEPEEVTTQEA
ncbi:MAG TPA: diadenylate cyclase CdaA [Candidatus Omnitrophota bacterium]|jgi:diadenylate cyclase|nr:diadenylate cyclase CdaA [Candidatus Eisenbacteria bacterium]HEU4765128.1 diadenylate cyclase CdaA [Candidatus Eisenbacteria bacterium]HTM00331.1 diadenylate cyclase CdaA [Candidatus Omnitrophota bacterium]